MLLTSEPFLCPRRGIIFNCGKISDFLKMFCTSIEFLIFFSFFQSIWCILFIESCNPVINIICSGSMISLRYYIALANMSLRTFTSMSITNIGLLFSFLFVSFSGILSVQHWPLTIRWEGAEEMVQQLRAFTAQPKNLDLVPSIHMTANNYPQLQFPEIECPLLASMSITHTWCIYIHA